MPHFENASDAISDLRAKNQIQYAVEDKFSVNVPSALISKEAENMLLHHPTVNRVDAEDVKRIQDGWQQFYQDHPGAAGILSISRVGFNSDKSLAVVYIAAKTSMMMANGKCYLLAKKNGSWEIEKEEMIWFS